MASTEPKRTLVSVVDRYVEKNDWKKVGRNMEIASYEVTKVCKLVTLAFSEHHCSPVPIATMLREPELYSQKHTVCHHHLLLLLLEVEHYDQN